MSTSFAAGCCPSVFVSDAEIDRIIAEDLPYLDLTTYVMGIGEELGAMEYFTREACVLCGTEEASRVAVKLGCTVLWSQPSGTELAAGETFMRLEGTAAQLHAAWKVCLNLFDHLSAVATKTRSMVDAAHGANPTCEVLTTRKSMPGVKSLLTKAVLAGGAFPHRLGLSETVLVFEQHRAFTGGFDGFVASLPGVKSLLTKAVLAGGAFPHRLGLSETVLVFEQHRAFTGGFDGFVASLPELRTKVVEKKLLVEASAEEALVLAEAGVDGVQLDKVPVEEMGSLVRRLKAIDPHLTVIAAGGINPGNVAAYAATGVDALVTTAPFEEMGSLVRRLKAIDPHLTVIAAGGINPGNVAAYAATGVDALVTTAPFTAKPVDMSVRMGPR